MTDRVASFVAMPPGYRHVALGSVESTNSEAMRLALAGEPGGLWITADEQVKGRGRSGRAWTSVPGNLYASLLLRPACPPLVAQQLSLVAGVAVAGTVRAVQNSGRPPFPATPESEPPCHGQMVAVPNFTPRLKWPNDILIGDAKLGGILVESAIMGSDPAPAVVIGIGLNVAGVPEGLGRDATSLAAHGVAAGRDSVLAALAREMDIELKVWAAGAGFAAIRSAWIARAGPIGERLAVNAGGNAVSGYYAGLDDDGALLLRDDLGATRRFTYGDVTLAVRGEQT